MPKECKYTLKVITGLLLGGAGQGDFLWAFFGEGRGFVFCSECTLGDRFSFSPKRFFELHWSTHHLYSPSAYCTRPPAALLLAPSIHSPHLFYSNQSISSHFFLFNYQHTTTIYIHHVSVIIYHGNY